MKKTVEKKSVSEKMVVVNNKVIMMTMMIKMWSMINEDLNPYFLNLIINSQDLEFLLLLMMMVVLLWADDLWMMIVVYRDEDKDQKVYKVKLDDLKGSISRTGNQIEVCFWFSDQTLNWKEKLMTICYESCYE